MKWLRNALIGLMREAAAAELKHQRAAEQAHVTELVTVLHKATDEFTHALSREAMRKARAEAASRKEAGEQGEGGGTVHNLAPVPDGLTPKQVARLRMQRMMGNNTRSG